MHQRDSLQLSIVMPCLNEASTVGLCVEEAKTFLRNNHILGEILVVDNGSTDGSAFIAAEHGVNVIGEPRKGYGNALRTGIANSQGKCIILGDCDTTYDFLHLEEMYCLLQKDCDMVIGNRFAGGMEKGSMPWSHRWGVRALSYLGRSKFPVDVYDFHCGLRGLTRQAAEKLELCTEGMEFATEMIVQAVRQQLQIKEIPVVLRVCHYPRTSKLRTLCDGVRHLLYILKTPCGKG